MTGLSQINRKTERERERERDRQEERHRKMLERDKVRYIYKKRVKELGKRGWREER